MVLVLKLIYKYYNDKIDHYTDPRTKDFFLSQNPFIPLGIVVIYLQFVLKRGPHLMKDRPAFNLKKILIVYNLLQIILSARLFNIGLNVYIFGPYKFYCEPVDYSDNPSAVLLANAVYKYYLVKIFDLLDTVFFVLRKKQKQVSFLHIYHHIGMVIGVWIGVRFVPGGHVIFIGFINSFVHILMYSYYLRAIFNNSSSIWWKKYITLLQIFQFGMITIQWVLMVLGPSCGFPKFIAIAFVPQNIFMTVMFLDFYYKAYVKHK